MKKAILFFATVVVLSFCNVKAQVNDTVIYKEQDIPVEVMEVPSEDDIIIFPEDDSDGYAVNFINFGENKARGFLKKLDLSASYGMLSWSRMNGAGDLFSSPEGVYDLSFAKGKHFAIDLTAEYVFNRRFSANFGLGFESDVFLFANDVIFDGNKIVSSDDKAKEKLVARYITLPVTFKYHFSGRWGVSLGVIAGINYNNSHTGFKRHYIENGIHTDQNWGKTFDNFNRWKIDGRVAVHYRRLSLYAQQSLLPLFKDGKEQKLYPFSIGIGVGI